MSVARVLRSNRDFNVGAVDFFSVFTCNAGEVLIFVKKRLEFYDVLAFEKNDLYFSHYKFPLSYDYDGIIDVLKSIM